MKWHFGPPSAMLKTSGNALTLLLTGPPSNLSGTSTTSSSCPPKKSTTPASYLASDNPKRLWQTVNKLLHRKSSSPLPTTSPGTSLADSFASFFTGKISKLRLSLTSNPATSSPHSPSPPATPPNFSVIRGQQDPLQLSKQTI